MKYYIERIFMRFLGLCPRCLFSIYWIDGSTAACPFCGMRSHK